MQFFAIAFRPLFERVGEGDLSRAIVTYGKRPHSYKDVPLTLEVAAGGTDMQYRTTLYEHRLQIDLLFAVVRFCWRDK